jgi:hypothetical protein
MIRRITFGVTCQECGIEYGQEDEYTLEQDLLRQAMRKTPCCGSCGSADITLAISTKTLKGY